MAGRCPVVKRARDLSPRDLVDIRIHARRWLPKRR
jgi:hypothetical protein